MYSPKIREDLIPRLYWLGKRQKRPMTTLVAEAIEQYLAAHERSLHCLERGEALCADPPFQAPVSCRSVESNNRA